MDALANFVTLPLYLGLFSKEQDENSRKIFLPYEQLR
jgi:hypothetical protein